MPPSHSTVNDSELTFGEGFANTDISVVQHIHLPRELGGITQEQGCEEWAATGTLGAPLEQHN